MNYQIQSTENGQVRVLADGQILKARFHRREQAEQYIAEQEQKEKDSYANRKGYLFAYGPIPNIYAENLLSYPQ